MSDDEKRESYLAAPWHKSARHHCFGCSRSNPAGLAMQMRESNERLVCDFTLTRLHESYPGLIHGGVSAAVLDELMGNVLVHRERKVCFTAGLRLIYLGALRIERVETVVAPRDLGLLGFLYDVGFAPSQRLPFVLRLPG